MNKEFLLTGKCNCNNKMSILRKKFMGKYKNVIAIGQIACLLLNKHNKYIEFFI